MTDSCGPPCGGAREAGPHGLRSSLERDDIAVDPLHRPRSVVYRPPLLGFVGAARQPKLARGGPVPLHRPDPRRSPSRGVSTASDPSCKLESRSDLVVLHDLVGFLRRLPGFSPGYPPPFRVAEDSRACCIPLPIMGFDAFLRFIRWSRPHERHHRWHRSSPDTRTRGSPHRVFVPPGGLPLLAAVARHRAPCLLGLRCAAGPRPSRGVRFQTSRSCRTDGLLSLEALLREQVRTIDHR